MRVLVTGSREFTERSAIHQALDLINGQPGPHTLVHGAAKGADQTAAKHAMKLGWTIEPHPADWSQPCTDRCRHRGLRNQTPGRSFCPAAGAMRNAAMVRLGADVVLAFFAAQAENRGTTDCVKRAKAAGLTVHEFRL